MSNWHQLREWILIWGVGDWDLGPFRGGFGFAVLLWCSVVQRSVADGHWPRGVY